MGRKDKQVKIRGHRIELSEIENAILRYPNVSQVVVKTLEKQSQKQIVAFVVSTNSKETDSLLEFLSNQLPSYMLPEQIENRSEFPTLPNGKVNINALEITSTKSEKPKEEKRTKMQQDLLEIWQEVLHKEVQSIYQNFFDLGGDSILSIQIVAKSNQRKIGLQPEDLFRYQTIAKLSAVLQKRVTPQAEKQIQLEGKFDLTPIQKWFFRTHGRVKDWWNLGVEFKLTNEHSIRKLKEFWTIMLDYHAVLRSAFQQQDGIWQGEIDTEYRPDEFIEVISSLEIDNQIEMMQQSFQLGQGNLCKVLIQESSQHSSDRIILLVHHLVVDVVSFPLIANQFEEFLKSGSVNLPDRSESFIGWSEWINHEESRRKAMDEFEFWRAQVPKLSQQKDYTIESDLQRVDHVLSMGDLEIVEIENFLKCKIHEFLIGTFTIAYFIDSKTSELLLWLESHGRPNHLPLSGVVGWFTSFYPLRFQNNEPGEWLQTWKKVKEKLRSVPRLGIGYGVLTYIEELNDLEIQSDQGVLFNYLGTSATKKNDLLQTRFLFDGLRHPNSIQPYQLELNVRFDHDQLVVNTTHAEKVMSRSAVQILLKNWEKVIFEIMDAAKRAGDHQFTPSDFPDVNLDQSDLDQLLSSL